MKHISINYRMKHIHISFLQLIDPEDQHIICNGYSDNEESNLHAESSGSEFQISEGEQEEQEEEEVEYEEEEEEEDEVSSLSERSTTSESTIDYDYLSSDDSRRRVKRRKVSKHTQSDTDYDCYYSSGEGEEDEDQGDRRYNLRKLNTSKIQDNVEALSLSSDSESMDEDSVEEFMETEENEDKPVLLDISNNTPKQVQQQLQQEEMEMEQEIDVVGEDSPPKDAYYRTQQARLRLVDEKIQHLSSKLQSLKSTPPTSNTTGTLAEILLISNDISNSYQEKFKIEKSIEQMDQADEYVYGLNTPFSPLTEQVQDYIEMEWEKAVRVGEQQVREEEVLSDEEQGPKVWVISDDDEDQERENVQQQENQLDQERENVQQQENQLDQDQDQENVQQQENQLDQDQDQENVQQLENQDQDRDQENVQQEENQLDQDQQQEEQENQVEQEVGISSDNEAECKCPSPGRNGVHVTPDNIGTFTGKIDWQEYRFARLRAARRLQKEHDRKVFQKECKLFKSEADSTQW